MKYILLVLHLLIAMEVCAQSRFSSQLEAETRFYGLHADSTYLTYSSVDFHVEYRAERIQVVLRPSLTLMYSENGGWMHSDVFQIVPDPDGYPHLSLEEGFIEMRTGRVKTGVGIRSQDVFLDGDAPVDFLRHGAYDYTLPFDPRFRPLPAVWLQVGGDLKHVRISGEYGHRGVRMPYLSGMNIPYSLKQRWSVRADGKIPFGDTDLLLHARNGMTIWPRATEIGLYYTREYLGILALNRPVGLSNLLKIQGGLGGIDGHRFYLFLGEFEYQGKFMRSLVGAGAIRQEQDVLVSDIRYLLGNSLYGGLERIFGRWRLRLTGYYQPESSGWILQPKLAFRTRSFQVEAEARILDGKKLFFEALSRDDHVVIRMLLHL